MSKESNIDKLMLQYLLSMQKKSAIIELILEGLYKCQRKFLLDRSLLKCLQTPRQVGKTFTVGKYLAKYNIENTNPDAISVYACDTREHAKKIIWSRLLNLLEELGISYKENKVDLSIVFADNKSRLDLYGLDDEKKAKALRGLQYGLVIIDEAQEIKSDHLAKVIKENVSAGLKTFRGTLCLTGTPGPVPDGFFYEACCGKRGFKHFTWNQYDNVLYPEWKDIPDTFRNDYITNWLKKIAEEEYGGMDVPAFRREYMGEWCQDADAYCYHLSEEKNLLGDVPSDLRYVIGVDLGTEDATAIVVVGYNRKRTECYVVHEFAKSNMLLNDVVYELRFLIEKYGHSLDRIRMDRAGGGAMITDTTANEIRWRYPKVPIVGADKPKKAAYMLLMDNALRTGKLKLNKGALWSQLANLVKDTDKQIEQLNQPCDLADALLYAFRDALYFIPEEEEKSKQLNNDPFALVDEYEGLLA